MEIIIHIEKKKLDTDYAQAIAEYQKRLSPFCKLKIVTYKNISKICIQNGSALYTVVPGKHTLSSEELAAFIEQEGISGHSRLEFILCENSNQPAGSELSTQEDLQNAKPFCVSSFTMSCDLTAVVLSEQLYRAFTIINHITYHK